MSDPDFEVRYQRRPEWQTTFENLVESWSLRHISGRELTPYFRRKKNGVLNSFPPPELWVNFRRPLIIADTIRARGDFGRVHILSSYRSHDYNAAVGGVANSFHTQCLALDVNFDRGTPSSWAGCARQVMRDMVCPGGIGTYYSRGFIHIDVRGSWAYWFKR